MIEYIKKHKIIFAVGAVSSAAMLALMNVFRWFVLDDAYIIYRYSNNLARAYGFVWNIGEDPVEGFTSFLWVVLNAAAIRVGMDPVVFSKALSAIAAIAIIWILASNVDKKNPLVSILFVAAFALSPAFALLAMQGLETALATAFITLAAAAALSYIAWPTFARSIVFYTWCFIAMVTRPDAVVFCAGATVAICLVLASKKYYVALRRFILTTVPFVIEGSLYMAWRITYFGHALPNTFYIKSNTSGSSIVTLASLKYLGGFLFNILWPYLLLAGILALVHRKKRRLVDAAPLLAGVVAHLLYILTINPIQGFMWRFIFPVYPALLLAAIYYFRGIDLGERTFGKKFALGAAALFFALWPMKTLSEAQSETKWRTQVDRVIIGKALAGLQGRMFISESGALPFYSDWRAVDLLGLNSEDIAHNGLSRQLLERFDPDIVMLYLRTYDRNFNNTLHDFMVEHGYVAVALVRKNDSMNHLYFVKNTSPIRDQVVKRIRNAPGARFRDIRAFMNADDIPVVDR